MARCAPASMKRKEKITLKLKKSGVKKLHSLRNFLGNCRHEEANDNNLFMLPVASVNTDTQWLCAEKRLISNSSHIILRFWDADLVAHAITMNEVRENNDTLFLEF